MRPRYQRCAGLPDALRRAGEMRARTLLLDVEPLVTFWDSGQDVLDRAVTHVVEQIAAIPGVRVVCFTTNSARRPSLVPHREGMEVVYLASALKPLRTRPYRHLPRPGVVIGDQIATDGILARRLGYAFLRCVPPLDRIPAGPRLMDGCGRVVRPLVFARPR